MTSPFKKGRKRDKRAYFVKWESIIEKELKTTNKDRRTRMFASSAGLCERQTAGLFYLSKDFESTRKASTQFYFKTGNAFEDVVATSFLNAGILIDRETRIEAYHEQLPISGRIDFVVEDRENDNELVLVELKSCGKLPAAPRAAHKAQLLTYLALTGMSKGIIWYISRTVAGWDGNLIQRAFEIEPSGKELKNTLFKMALGALAIKKRIVPKKPDEMKKYKCGFCTLIPYCWNSQEDMLVDTKTINNEQYYKLTNRAWVIVEEVMEHRPVLKEQFLDLMSG